MDALMADRASTGLDLVTYGKAAEDALRQCIIDKQALPGIFAPPPVKEPPRFRWWGGREPDR